MASFAGRGIALGNQVFGSGNEVIEDVLFFALHSGLVPLLAVFAPAAEAGLGIDATHFEPDEVGHGEARSEADVEPTIPIQARGIFAVQFQAAFVNDEHGDAGSILALVEDLFCFEVARAEFDFGLAENGARCGFEVEAIDRPGHSKAGEGIESFGVAAFTGESAHSPDVGQGNLLAGVALEVEHFYLGMRVDEVINEELVSDDPGFGDGVLTLRNNFLPVGAFGLAGVNGNDAAARGVEVGLKPEDGAIVVDELIGSVKVIEQADDVVTRTG